jgi:hypothetical protein
LPDALAGVDVDDRHRLRALDDEVAARGQPHLAIERLVDLLDDPVGLERREWARVQRDLLGQIGRHLAEVVHDEPVHPL